MLKVGELSREEMLEPKVSDPNSVRSLTCIRLSAFDHISFLTPSTGFWTLSPLLFNTNCLSPRLQNWSWSNKQCTQIRVIKVSGFIIDGLWNKVCIPLLSRHLSAHVSLMSSPISSQILGRKYWSLRLKRSRSYWKRKKTANVGSALTRSLLHCLKLTFLLSFSLISLTTGCMQTLSHYLILLSKCESESQNCQELTEEATSLLERLVEVDSDRKERYRDVLKSLKRLKM